MSRKEYFSIMKANSQFLAIKKIKSQNKSQEKILSIKTTLSIMILVLKKK
jgi:hypothetical protein